MKLEDIEKELESAFEQPDIASDLLYVWASNYGKELIEVAKAAKNYINSDHAKESDILGLAIEELEKG